LKEKQLPHYIFQELLKHDLPHETLTTKTKKNFNNSNPLYLT